MYEPVVIYYLIKCKLVCCLVFRSFLMRRLFIALTLSLSDWKRIRHFSSLRAMAGAKASLASNVIGGWLWPSLIRTFFPMVFYSVHWTTGGYEYVIEKWKHFIAVPALQYAVLLIDSSSFGKWAELKRLSRHRNLSNDVFNVHFFIPVDFNPERRCHNQVPRLFFPGQASKVNRNENAEN